MCVLDTTMALDISAIENDDGSTYTILDHVNLNSSEEDVEVEVGAQEEVVTISNEPQPSTSSAPQATKPKPTRIKPPKRARSPLPIVESDGPQFTPNNGGFTGSGKYKFIS